MAILQNLSATLTKERLIKKKRELESNTQLLACIYVDNLLLTPFKVALNGTLQSISAGRI